MKKLLLSLFCLSSVLFSANAVLANEEEVVTKEVAKNYSGLGLGAGAISGIGFTYRQFFADKFAFKSSAGAYIDNNGGAFSIGTQGMWILSENDWLRFYVLGGLSDIGRSWNSYIASAPDPAPTPVEKQTENVQNNGTPVNNNQNSTTATSSDPVPAKITPEAQPERITSSSNYFNFGAGIGIEIGRKEHGLSLGLELPLVVSIANFNKLEYISPIPQVSLVYNF